MPVVAACVIAVVELTYLLDAPLDRRGGDFPGCSVGPYLHPMMMGMMGMTEMM